MRSGFAQEGQTGRSAAEMRRRVLVLLLVLGPMEILRRRGDALLGSSTSTALRAESEYEYGGRRHGGLSEDAHQQKWRRGRDSNPR